MQVRERRVLVVDDEENVRELLKRILEERGYEVTTAANGNEAVYKLSLGEAGVVLLDIRMPGMSGLEVLSMITADQLERCVIMITAVTDTQTAVEAMKMGAYDYITKPFNKDEVLRKMQEAIERWNRQLQEKLHYHKLCESITEQTQRMRMQFIELVHSLAREHKLLHELAAKQTDGGKSLLSRLPEGLQQPMPSVEEFRDALLRIMMSRKT
ncbi:response regulator [Chloroflexota bacterium]